VGAAAAVEAVELERVVEGVLERVDTWPLSSVVVAVAEPPVVVVVVEAVLFIDEADSVEVVVVLVVVVVAIRPVEVTVFPFSSVVVTVVSSAVFVGRVVTTTAPVMVLPLGSVVVTVMT